MTINLGLVIDDSVYIMHVMSEIQTGNVRHISEEMADDLRGRLEYILEELGSEDGPSAYDVRKSHGL